ncbi:phosphotransferase family protein [Nesterenkonia muleiensis]|uniref:phosphotransferase family protein n=1 Tax=Nesterenkonia muleiensis TaxID=2282648 RepID=UPI000E7210E0|nr:phosphotransferase [Nesterenkonia muleiensis]
MNAATMLQHTSRPDQLIPPHRVEVSGETLTVRRAWPVPADKDASGELAVELTDGRGLRAGWWGRNGPRLLNAGEDPKLRDLKDLLSPGKGHQASEIVSHRPGKRAVVRRETAHSTETVTVEFVKVVRRGKAAGVLDGIRRAEPFTGPFRTPDVLDHSDSTVTFAALEGVSLHNPGALGQDQWVQAWNEVCRAWAQTVTGSLQSAPQVTARTGALVHRAESESGVLRHWFHLTVGYLPDAAQTERRVADISAQLNRLNEDRLVPAHRDLHDKQLLWSRRRGPGLLDVDTACLADPALDLGNLRAHALLRTLQGVWSARQAETVRFCVDEAAEQCAVPRSTVAVYERAALMRLGLVYAVRPQYADVAAELRQVL